MGRKEGKIMSYTREDIIKELSNRGYKAIPNDVYRNNAKLRGIVIGESRANPCIYIDDFLEKGVSLEETINTIINIYESNKSVTFDIDEILSKDWVMEHIYIALQRTSNEPLIKKQSKFEGIEEYLYLKGSSFSIRLNEGLISRIEVSIEELWDRANSNTFRNGEVSISSIVDALGLDCTCDCYESDIPLFVVTNQEKHKGSIMIFSDEVISFAKSKGAKYLLALPSSIHEFIIYVVKEDLSTSELEEMKRNLSSIICCVNEQEVDEEEQLGEQPFVIKV